MGLILDTCILIYAEKQVKAKVIDVFQRKHYGDAYISAITVSELLVGVHRANTEVRRLKRAAFVETIISELPILDFTLEIARIPAELDAHLSVHGQQIGSHDLLIAAMAVAYGYPLLTSNLQEFRRIPGLKVVW